MKLPWKLLCLCALVVIPFLHGPGEAVAAAGDSVSIEAFLYGGRGWGFCASYGGPFQMEGSVADQGTASTMICYSWFGPVVPTYSFHGAAGSLTMQANGNQYVVVGGTGRYAGSQGTFSGQVQYGWGWFFPSSISIHLEGDLVLAR